MRTIRTSAVAVAVLASVALPMNAVAQAVTQAGSPAASAAPAAPARQGLWFNAGLGAGSLGCDGCDSRESAMSGGLALGGTLTQRVLLGAGTAGWTKSEDGGALTVGALNAVVRFYPSVARGFFLLGGVGMGTINVEIDGFGSESETGSAAILGLGYDFRVGRNVSMTPFWNGFAVKTSNADANVGQIGVGVTVH